MVKSLPLALLISAGLLSSTVTASAYITYGNTVVNGETYDLSPDANLWGANLYGANLYNANLYYAYLSEADLRYANLSLADLRYANLIGANLRYANLTGATVSYSNWTDFSTNSGALALTSYAYDTSLITYANAPAVPEPSTYGLIGVVALGLALAARRKKLKKA
jgi:uncharacterized protein YjbI with pentapeptide repeats